MAIASSCCLNLSPPTPPAAGSNPSLNIPETKFASWKKNEGRWRNRCVLGMAAGCVIIGLEMSNSSVIIGENKNIAIAEDMLSQVAAVESNGKNNTVAKWSDKRKCPPWRVNSLETIVPENLPRPTARRRWESVGFSKTAPPVQMAVKIRTTTSCFSM